MAAMIETMAFAGETPWHGLGTTLHDDDCLSWEKTCDKAGLNWAVERIPLLRKDTWDESSHFALVRSTDKKTLSVVGPDYEPLQNTDTFKWFDPFLQAGEAVFHTAGSLCGGQKVWVLAKLNRDPLEIAPGDTVDKYILLSNGHGGMSIRAGFTPIRVVCANTLAVAHHGGESKLIRLRHTKNHGKALEAVRDVMNVANESFEATAEQYRKLVTKTINKSDLRKYVKLVLDLPTDLKEEADISSRSKNIIASIEELFESGRGNNLKGVRGTAWAAYNAVTEYLSYRRGNDDSNRLNSLWFGDSATMNQRAFEAALEMVA